MHHALIHNTREHHRCTNSPSFPCFMYLKGRLRVRPLKVEKEQITIFLSFYKHTTPGWKIFPSSKYVVKINHLKYSISC